MESREKHAASRVVVRLVENMPDGALLLDREMRMWTFNRGFVHFTGVHARTLERKLRVEPFPLDLFGFPEARRAAESCMSEGRAVHVHEITVEALDGTSRTANLSLIPVVDPEGGEPFALVFAVRDVSGESRMQYHYKDLLESERRRVEELERRVEERTRALQNALEEVSRLASIDPLTGALNRRSFVEFAEQALQMAHRHERSCAFLMCDLDFFKTFNDRFGHQVGDQALCAAVAALEGSVRGSDKVARLGGEEFAVLLPETEPASVVVVAQRCADAVRAIQLDEASRSMDATLTMSIGCAIYPFDGATLDDLMRAADRALYDAKRRGRDRVEVASARKTVLTTT